MFLCQTWKLPVWTTQVSARLIIHCISTPPVSKFERISDYQARPSYPIAFSFKDTMTTSSNGQGSITTILTQSNGDSSGEGTLRLQTNSPSPITQEDSQSERRTVRWTDEVVDNEHMNKKKSKGMYIQPITMIAIDLQDTNTCLIRRHSLLHFPPTTSIRRVF